MQLKESTAEYLCKQLNIQYIHNQTVYNPIHNIQIGTQYLINNVPEDNDIEHTIKCFVGGPKFNNKNSYVQYYKNQILKEYNKLTYIEKGIKYDFNSRRGRR